MARTHYQVLDVDSTADRAAVRRAYHQAARKWHPDRFAGRPSSEAAKAEANMRRLNQAYEVLGDVQRRKSYDLELRRGNGSSSTSIPASSATEPDDDGVIRIDPRLLDPSFLASRRHVQADEISNRTSFILRVAPVVAVVGLLGAIFVFTAYARDGGEVAAPTTVPGPSLGTGIEANDCVTVLTGPALLERPCDAGADGMVIGARLADGVCPVGTIREVELSNGAIACLGDVV